MPLAIANGDGRCSSTHSSHHSDGGSSLDPTVPPSTTLSPAELTSLLTPSTLSKREKRKRSERADFYSIDTITLSPSITSPAPPTPPSSLLTPDADQSTLYTAYLHTHAELSQAQERLVLMEEVLHEERTAKRESVHDNKRLRKQNRELEQELAQCRRGNRDAMVLAKIDALLQSEY
jgi:hypothetical protein